MTIGACDSLILQLWLIWCACERGSVTTLIIVQLSSVYNNFLSASCIATIATNQCTGNTNCRLYTDLDCTYAIFNTCSKLVHDLTQW